MNHDAVDLVRERIEDEHAPLNDRAYEPAHPPVHGVVPEVVAKWGPFSQIRWFRRYEPQLRSWSPTNWTRGKADLYFVESVMHKGWCCASCGDEEEYGFGGVDDCYCCCRAIKASEKEATG